jgi:hypothetical protein
MTDRLEVSMPWLLCATRRRHHDWGPEKLLDYLRPRYPGMDWPAVSTAGDLLKRRGLVKPRRRRYRASHPGVIPPTTHTPNDLWTADFKGEFRTGDDEYCYPLTVADQHTRCLLGCGGLRSTRYRPSPRPYPDPLPPIEHPGHFTVREITAAGTFRFKERPLYLSNALKHYPLGLEEVADGVWSVYFCHVLLARIDERTGTLNRG